MRKIHKVWLVGSNSKLGKQLLNELNFRKLSILSTDNDDVNVTEIDDALGFSYLNQPDAIINCFEYFNKDQSNYKDFFKINTLAARNLAICSRKIGARLIHISTDLVFNSEASKSYNEFDIPNPKSTYAISKYEGEKFVKELAQKYFIIRTSYLYDKTNNFEDILNIYNHRMFSPTSTTELSKFIIMLMNTPEYGTYHASDLGYCSYNEFIAEVNKILNSNYSLIEENTLNKIELNQFMLDISNLYKFKYWKSDLEKTIK